MIRPVILCGGSGSRLWPKSRESHPKQFIKITPNQNLLDVTLERIKIFNNFFVGRTKKFGRTKSFFGRTIFSVSNFSYVQKQFSVRPKFFCTSRKKIIQKVFLSYAKKLTCFF